MLPDFIAEALTSYPTLFLICVFVGFPIPFPEDIIVMTAGTLVAEGRLEFWPTAATCGAAMFVRDLNAFLFARRFADWLMRRPKVRAALGEKNIERWSRLFANRGGLGIFLVRFCVGTRVKLLFIAAALGVSRRTFAVYDILGMFFVAPLLVWLGFRFGQPIIDGLTRALAYAGPVVSLSILGLFVFVILRWRRRRGEALTEVADPEPSTYS